MQYIASEGAAALLVQGWYMQVLVASLLHY